MKITDAVITPVVITTFGAFTVDKITHIMAINESMTILFSTNNG